MKLLENKAHAGRRRFSACWNVAFCLSALFVPQSLLVCGGCRRPHNNLAAPNHNFRDGTDKSAEDVPIWTTELYLPTSPRTQSQVKEFLLKVQNQQTAREKEKLFVETVHLQLEMDSSGVPTEKKNPAAAWRSEKHIHQMKSFWCLDGKMAAVGLSPR